MIWINTGTYDNLEVNILHYIGEANNHLAELYESNLITIVILPLMMILVVDVVF